MLHMYTVCHQYAFWVNFEDDGDDDCRNVGSEPSRHHPCYIWNTRWQTAFPIPLWGDWKPADVCATVSYKATSPQSLCPENIWRQAEQQPQQSVCPVDPERCAGGVWGQNASKFTCCEDHSLWQWVHCEDWRCSLCWFPNPDWASEVPANRKAAVTGMDLEHC